MSEARRLLCRSGGPFMREAVYQTPDGLEVDLSEHYEVIRRRVFYDDVSLVTYHSDRGALYLVGTGLTGALFTFLGMFIVSLAVTAWPAALIFFAIGIPADALFLLRLIFGRDVITVFGRRSKAVLRFSAIRRARAREIYGEICAAIRRAQTAANAAQPASPAALAMPEGVPMPPEI